MTVSYPRGGSGSVPKETLRYINSVADGIARTANTDIARLESRDSASGGIAAVTVVADIPTAPTFGQQIFIQSATNLVQTIFTNVTYTDGMGRTQILRAPTNPIAAGGGTIGALDFRTQLGDDGQATNANSLFSLLGAAPVNIRIGMVDLTITAINQSGVAGGFGNTCTIGGSTPAQVDVVLNTGNAVQTSTTETFIADALYFYDGSAWRRITIT